MKKRELTKPVISERPTKRCPQTGKVAYRTETEALSRVDASRSEHPSKRLTHHYACEAGDHWHVSSKGSRTATASDGGARTYLLLAKGKQRGGLDKEVVARLEAFKRSL